jgi:16S rRNA (guanine(966)-N(2))-methyltransferase RsmD
MRIISGQLGGRRFRPPADKWPTRPTTDIAKEGLFNILENRLDFSEVRMLDLFGGTGNHSFEAISRGCMDVTYVDQYRPCTQFVKKVSLEWEVSDRLRILQRDVAKFLRAKQHEPYNYIFAGPPYPLKWLDKIPDLVFESGVLQTGGILVLEHNPNHDFSRHPAFNEKRNYGQTIFSFFY